MTKNILILLLVVVAIVLGIFLIANYQQKGLLTDNGGLETTPSPGISSTPSTSVILSPKPVVSVFIFEPWDMIRNSKGIPEFIDKNFSQSASLPFGCDATLEEKIGSKANIAIHIIEGIDGTNPTSKEGFRVSLIGGQNICATCAQVYEGIYNALSGEWDISFVVEKNTPQVWDIVLSCDVSPSGNSICSSRYNHFLEGKYGENNLGDKIISPGMITLFPDYCGQE